MDTVWNLINRLRFTVVMVFVGLLLIMYTGFGFVYWQQFSQREQLEKQIERLSAVISRPLPSDKQLREEYEAVNQALSPMTSSAAIEMLVRIANEHGIDIDPDLNKLRVPTATSSQANVGGGTYQLISFAGVNVQGDYSAVMAFISDLDSGKTLENMVLKKVTITQIEVDAVGEDGRRRAEFRNVISAVEAMMGDNNLSVIPNPINYAGGGATNQMGDSPLTMFVFEGFPDITTKAIDRDYTGDGSPRDGYVLYWHDKISTGNSTDNTSDNTSQFNTVSYIDTLATEYYYTAEGNGVVRQFDGKDVFTATEYLSSEAGKIEAVARIDIVIYTKPEG